MRWKRACERGSCTTRGTRTNARIRSHPSAFPPPLFLRIYIYIFRALFLSPPHIHRLTHTQTRDSIARFVPSVERESHSPSRKRYRPRRATLRREATYNVATLCAPLGRRTSRSTVHNHPQRPVDEINVAPAPPTSPCLSQFRRSRHLLNAVKRR